MCHLIFSPHFSKIYSVDFDSSLIIILILTISSKIFGQRILAFIVIDTHEFPGSSVSINKIDSYDESSLEYALNIYLVRRIFANESITYLLYRSALADRQSTIRMDKQQLYKHIIHLVFHFKQDIRFH